MVRRAIVAVLGGSGLVGSSALACWADAFELIAPAHAELDVLDAPAVAQFVAATPAQVIVNFAAVADVDGAQAEQGDLDGRVYHLNVRYPQHLAALCHRQAKHLVHISTDYVFDGTRTDRPYLETDPTNPLGWYAQTKRLAEQAIQEANAHACIARIEMPFTARPHPKPDLARLCLDRFRAGQHIRGVADQRITPVFLDDAVGALRVLIEARANGIVHVAASGSTTPYEFAVGIATRLDCGEALVEPVRFEDFALTRPARRPQHPWLDVSLFERRFGSGVLRSPAAQLDAWAEQVLAVRRPAPSRRSSGSTGRPNARVPEPIVIDLGHARPRLGETR